MLKNKKMLHLLILNQTQLTNEVLFSYSSGITELMSFISFKTFVPEILPLTFMNGNHDIVDTPVVILANIEEISHVHITLWCQLPY